MGRLDGKVAIVTGARAGLGRVIAAGFAAEGAKVVVVGRRDLSPTETEAYHPGIGTVELIAQNGGEAVGTLCDVRNADETEAMVQFAVDTFGRLDIAVNNAGGFTRLKRIDEMDQNDWDYTMGVNGKGVFNCCQAEVRQFLRQKSGGSIINVSSVGGLVALGMETVYCASKAAIVNMTRTIALDYAREGIRVNGIAPNFALTGLTYKSYHNEDRRKRIEDLTPMGRWMNVEEIVGPALFLASDGSSYVTGVTIPVDGGYTMK